MLPQARRGSCGILIEGAERVLIDTPPDLRLQLVRENITTLDRLIYTHAHYDHLGGLGELEYYVQLCSKTMLPVAASEQALAQISKEFEYLTYCLDMSSLTAFEQFQYDGLRYTPLPVQHSEGTFGFLIESDASRLFYACDTGKLPSETTELINGVDTLILDATFWKNNYAPTRHNSIFETIEEALALEAKTLYLTHLALHYDETVTLAEIEAHLQQYNGRVLVAYDGLRLDI